MTRRPLAEQPAVITGRLGLQSEETSVRDVQDSVMNSRRQKNSAIKQLREYRVDRQKVVIDLSCSRLLTARFLISSSLPLVRLKNDPKPRLASHPFVLCQIYLVANVVCQI